MKVLNSIDKLCEKYGSDKCPKIAHSYAPTYDRIFKDKKDAKKVFEIGAGSRHCMSHYLPDYINCASLYVWRDYFKKAQIYSIDICEECLIKEDRINVMMADQYEPKDLCKVLQKFGKDYDIIIDDGSHRTEHQIFTAEYFLDFMKDDSIYCIEDIREPQRLLEAFKDYNLELYQYNLKKNDCLLVIRKINDS